MRQPYKDITDAVTNLIREIHLQTQQYYGIHDDCTTPRPDGRCSCVATPRWWDEHGVPRFGAHSPLLCPDVGATEVALIQIACQACAKEFAVQMSWSQSRVLRSAAFAKHQLGYAAVHGGELARRMPMTSLSYQISDRGPHYGDPPFHEDCRAGNTMNVWDLRVLEFWRKKEASIEYVRIPELEVPLPDLHDKDRVGPS